MTDAPRSVAKVRAAVEALPEATSYGEVPDVASVYFPQSHLKALDPDVSVVTGMRGAGKTFWWAALQTASVRELIGQHHERTKVSDKTEVRTGFGVRQQLEQYPSKDVLNQMLAQGMDARLMWRTVQAWQLAPDDHPLRNQSDWPARGAYVQRDPSAVDQMFEQRDRELARAGRQSVVIYDALDRSADDWPTMHRIIRGLLQTALDMRAYRHIRVKALLRPDQFGQAAVADFPDASKLLASAVELNWPRHELYGLLWHLLGNGSASERMREIICEGEKDVLAAGAFGAWQVPRELVFDEARQRRQFEAFAGEWMGRDPKRGFPYTWIPNHLGDAEGKVSPRSFIAALKAAAAHTRERYEGHRYALHYESIKGGVQEASKIRVAELAEDYPWVDRVLRDLKGLVVPCSFAEIKKRWDDGKTLTSLLEDIDQKDVKLPPSRIAEGAEGVGQDLESLRVFQGLYDGRVNMPDVFRVGYGLGRRGGVRPVGGSR